MKVTNVVPLPEYKLQVSFNDGISGVVDLKTFIQNGIFSVLKNERLFNKVSCTPSSIFWNEDLEIDILNVYAELTGKAPADILFKDISHAAN